MRYGYLSVLLALALVAGPAGAGRSFIGCCRFCYIFLTFVVVLCVYGRCRSVAQSVFVGW